MKDYGSGFVLVDPEAALALAKEKIQTIEDTRKRIDEEKIAETIEYRSRPRFFGLLIPSPCTREQAIEYLEAQDFLFGWKSCKYENSETRLVKVQILAEAAIENDEPNIMINEWLAASLYRHKYNG
jgi:hypothetical protein